MIDAPTINSHCPRCGGGFMCGINSPEPCVCTTLTLTPEVQAQLRQTWTGCLCLNCLRELAQQAQTLDEPPRAR